MARAPRILYENAIYHAYTRGNSKKDIFKSKEDFEVFLKICSNTYKKVKFNLLSYCLMSNHYHFLIQTPDANLPDIMRLINQKYAFYFNRKYNDVGYVFQGRYKAKLVDDALYLNKLVYYINLNPVQAKLVNNIDDWPWSSYYCLMKDTISPEFFKPQILEEVLACNNIKNYFKNIAFISRGTKTFEAKDTFSILMMKLLEIDDNELSIKEKNEMKVKECQKAGILSQKEISKLLSISVRTIRRINVR